MNTIVVGHDGSSPADEALVFAATEAELRGCSVLVVESWTDPVFGALEEEPDLSDLDAIRARVEAELRSVVDGVAASRPAVAFSCELAAGPPGEVLLAASHDAELLVVGSRGRGGFSSLLLGSVSRQVASASRIPVVVVRSAGQRGGGEIVVGVDGSGAGREALAWAGRESHLRELPLRVVLTWSYLRPEGVHGAQGFQDSYSGSSAEAILCTIVRDVLGGDPDVEVRLESRKDLPAKALVERSRGASLLVLGSRPPSVHRPFDSGSVSLQVLHHAECPTVIVPGDEA